MHPAEKLLSLQAVADSLGKTRTTCLRVAVELGVGRRIGRAWAFTSRESVKIGAAIKPRGNPNMVAGNDLWRHRKKRNKSKNP